MFRALTAAMLATLLIGVTLLTPWRPDSGGDLGPTRPVSAAPHAGFVRHIGTASSTTQGTSLALTVGGSGVTNGNTVVVSFATTGNPTGLQCADSAGNQYGFDFALSAFQPFSPPYVFVCAANNVQGISATSKITVSSDAPGVVNRAMTAAEFTGIDFLPPTNSANLGFASAGGATSAMASDVLTTLTPHVLLIGAFGIAGPGSDPFTADPLYASIPGTGTSTGSNDVTVRAEYRIVAATGAYTASGTIGPPPTNRNWAGTVLGLKLLPPPPTPTATPTFGPTSTPTATATPLAGLGNLKFLTNPVRVLDTRGSGLTVGFDGNGQAITAGQLPSGSTNRYKLAGKTFGAGPSQVTLPSNISGALINVTIVQPTGGGGFVTIFPGDVITTPVAATVLPPPAGTTPPGSAFRGNFAIIGIPTTGPPGPNTGTFAVTSVGDTRDLVVDLVGYYAGGNPNTVGNLNFIKPVRVLDTRPGSLIGKTAACQNITAGPITAGVVNKYGLAGCQFGTALEGNQIIFPSDVAGILAHITTVQPSGSGGFTTLLPGDAAIPSTATLNPVFPISFNSWANGIPTTGGQINGQGQFGVYSTNSQDVIVDIVGFFAPTNPSNVGVLNFIAPARVLDTRPNAPGVATTGFDAGGNAISAGPLPNNSTTRYRLNGMTFAGGTLTLPNDVKGALVNVTLVQTNAGGGFLTMFPGDALVAPTTATVNPHTNIAGSFWATGIPNPPSSNPGTFGLFSVGDPRDVVVDLSGYFR